MLNSAPVQCGRGSIGPLAAAVATVAMALGAPSSLRAEPPTPQSPPKQLVEARGKKVAVLPFDALGLDADRVIKLESLFRNEIARLSGRSGPTRREIAAVIATDRRLAGCTGQPGCVSTIGEKLGVELAVAGNVAALGDSYVVNIKVIDVAGAAELGRITSDPLRGSPDELIEAVRVAAYRLLAPQRLRGSISLLADVQGATVILDGKIVGTTPLAGPIGGLPLGVHRIAVTRDGFSRFSREVTVRFQKTTKVVVRLATGDSATGPLTGSAPAPQADGPRPWYQSTWFIVGVGVVAATTGAVIGWQLSRDPVVDCSQGGCGVP